MNLLEYRLQEIKQDYEESKEAELFDMTLDEYRHMKWVMHYKIIKERYGSLLRRMGEMSSKKEHY